MMDIKTLLKENIDLFTSIGNDPTGGMTRLLYSDSWLEAQNQLKATLEESGMMTQFDEIGNLFGRLEGSMYPDETILSGSHIDTVVNGGNLDGQYGIIAAYLAVHYLKETYGQPLRSLEVISMAEEEGSRFPMAFWGSKNFVNEAKKEDAIEMADFKGIKFVDAMKACGFDFKPETATKRTDVKAFLEIHIEQGNVLENKKLQIGVVNNIAGQRRYTVTLKGEANHAGTTPMGYRKDAVYAFSKICSEAIGKAEEVGDPLVLTFGKVEPKPNTVNVVPGEVLFTIDCRHTDKEELKNFTESLEKRMQEIAVGMGMTIDIDLWMDEAPVPMDESIVSVIEEAVKSENIDYLIMHSGAGHDSQIIAPHYPTAMIFVPSIKGISHNPAEETKIDDLVAGVKTLAGALYQLAYK